MAGKHFKVSFYILLLLGLLLFLLSAYPVFADEDIVIPLTEIQGAEEDGGLLNNSEEEGSEEVDSEEEGSEEESSEEESSSEEDSDIEKESSNEEENSSGGDQAVDNEQEEDQLEPPVIKGVKDGKTYTGPVNPRWLEEEGYEYEVLLEKDGQLAEDYEKGREIWEGGSYLLTVTVKDTDSNSEAIASVSFTILKTPYNTPNPGAKIIKEKLSGLPGHKQKMDLTLLKLIDEELLFQGESRDDLKAGLQTRKILRPGGQEMRGGKGASQEDRVYVYIYLDNKTSLQAVEPYISEVVNTDMKNHLLTAWVAIDRLEGLSQLKGVKKIRLVDEPIIRAVISEGDAIHKADQARLHFEQQGAGVKVGIISDSVDDLAVAQGRGELPGVTVLENDYPHTHSDEGIALLEIVHDLAPQAELYFHDCGGDIIAFNNAIAALKAAGCDIICDDVGWKYEPFFEDGLIASYVNKITDEVVYVSSAGNSAMEHYQGEYYDYILPDGSHFHDFSQGTSLDQKALLVKVPWQSAIEIILQWDDPFTLSGNDLDMWVYDLTYQKYITGENGYTFPPKVSQTYGLALQNGDDDPLETFIWENNNQEVNPRKEDVYLAVNVQNLNWDSDTNLEIFFYTYGGTEVEELYLVPEDSIFGHPAALGAIAVGAIAANDPGNDEIREYSSQGPVTIRGEPVKRIKPDLCGVDGVTVTWGLPGEKTYNFRGTSAAAPHVAAIAALLKAEYPSSTPGQICQVLKDSAVHLEEVPNGVFGYGLADALAALQSYDHNPPVVTVSEQTVTVAPLQTVMVQVDEESDVYLVRDGAIPEGENPSRESLEASIPLYLGAKSAAGEGGGSVEISSTGLVPGTYHIYAVDKFGNISEASANAVQVVATALNTSSGLIVDKTTVSIDEAEEAVFTVWLKDSEDLNAGCNWIYIVSDRLAGDFVELVQGAAGPITEEGSTRLLAGEDGIVVFSVKSDTEGVSLISVSLGSGALPLNGSPVELHFCAHPVVTVHDLSATDAPDQYIRLSSDHAVGAVYLVREDVPRATIAELESAALGSKGEKAMVTAAGEPVQVPTAGLLPGTYYAYASYDSFLSLPAAETIIISDGTKPEVITEGGNFTNSGETVAVASNEETGQVYIARDNIIPSALAVFTEAIAKHEAASGSVTAANTPVAIATDGLRGGTYLAYAVDGAGNISEPGVNPITITDVLPPVIVSFNPADNTTKVPVNTIIKIIFSEPVRHLGGAEITNDNAASLFTFAKNEALGEAVPYSASINGRKTELTLQPAQALAKGQKYYIGVNPQIEDEAGNPLSGPAAAVFTTVSGGSSGGGGGGGGGTQAGLIQPVTPDDYLLERELKRNGQARINLSANGQEQASLSGQVIKQLGERKLTLFVESAGISLEFRPGAFNSAELSSRDKVIISIRQLIGKEKPVVQGDPAYIDIGAAVYDLSAQISDRNGTVRSFDTFTQPVLVTVSLSGLELTSGQIAKLKGVRFEQGPVGKFVLIPLGGSYDQQSKAFSFSTDRFSPYSVMEVNSAAPAQAKPQVLELTIGQNQARINGQLRPLDSAPVIINDRTMVPLRFIGEALGAQINWEESTRTVVIISGSKNLRLVVGQAGEGLDSPPVIIGGRTMVPIRYIAEAFGAEVEWLGGSRTVVIIKR